MRLKKSKPNAAARTLADEWAAMIARHSKPLERGAVAKGQAPVKLKAKPLVEDHKVNVLKAAPIKGGGTVPAMDAELAAVKHNLAARTGQAYNKGGLQYLSDDELKEQRTGAHRRR